MEALTFDLETMKLAADLDGGWDALRRGEGGVSCLVLWSAHTGRPHLYDADTLNDAVDMLEAADVVLSFNGVGFDIPVLEGVLGRNLVLKSHIDLLQLIWEVVGREKGYKLTECSERALGTAKNGDGLLAPQLAEDNKWATLLDYCLNDVHLTRNLFLFAQKHGGIKDIDDEILVLPFPPWFKDVTI